MIGCLSPLPLEQVCFSCYTSIYLSAWSVIVRLLLKEEMHNMSECIEPIDYSNDGLNEEPNIKEKVLDEVLEASSVTEITKKKFSNPREFFDRLYGPDKNKVEELPVKQQSSDFVGRYQLFDPVETKRLKSENYSPEPQQNLRASPLVYPFLYQRLPLSHNPSHQIDPLHLPAGLVAFSKWDFPSIRVAGIPPPHTPFFS